MKKIIAVAVLFAGSFVVPTLPVQAGILDDTNCLIFPLLKKECRDMAKDAVMAPVKATAMAADEAADAADDHWVWPVWGGCVRAEAGSGHLYDCN